MVIINIPYTLVQVVVLHLVILRTMVGIFVAALGEFRFLGWLMLKRVELRLDGVALLATLLLQLVLGASIVVYGVPLAVAVAHNGVGALLLLMVLTANQRIRLN